MGKAVNSIAKPVSNFTGMDAGGMAVNPASAYKSANLGGGSSGGSAGAAPSYAVGQNLRGGFRGNVTNTVQGYKSDPDRPWETPTFEEAYNPATGRASGGAGLKLMTGPQGFGWYRDKTAKGDPTLLAQQYYANQFNQNLPMLGAQMGNRLAGQVNRQTAGDIKKINQNNSSRGLLYGGVNAGQEGAARSAGIAELAAGRSDINRGLLQANADMASSAIDTGVKVQQQQQSIQDQIYQNALAKMHAGSAATGAVLGAAGAVVGGVLGAAAGGVGAAPGAAAGYTVGNAAGRAL